MTYDRVHPLEPRSILEMFRAEEFAALLEATPLRSLSPDALEDAQARNMAALLSIQRAAAARYQVQFEAQIGAFEATLAAAEIEAKKAADQSTAEVPPPSGDAYQAALYAAASFTQAARAANTEALETIRGRIKATAADLSA